MKQKEWQSLFGEASGDFHLHLLNTLNHLEEKEMKKRYKFSTVLIAAALMLALLAGTAVAARELGLFDFLNTANPIVPLEGAEAMVRTHLGSTENELVKLEIEEAVYDGQGALIQLRYTPKDREKQALLHSAMDWITDDYIYRHEEYEDGSGMYELVGRKDGRQVIHVGETISFVDKNGDEIEINTWDGWEEADGSIVIQGSGSAEAGLSDEVVMTVSPRSYIQIPEEEGKTIEKGYVPLEPVSVQMQLAEEMRHVQLVPVGETKLERFKFLSGSISLTKVRAYMDISYAYQFVEEEPMGVTIKLYDGEGNEINVGSGGCQIENQEDGWEITREYGEMQSYEELPETIFVEVKVIGEVRTLGRIECRVVQE